MRVLVSTTGGVGHVLPVVPLARALLDAGHHVLWATGRGSAGPIVAAGIDAEEVGISEEELAPKRAELFGSFSQLPPDQMQMYGFPGLFGELLPPRAVADLLPLAREWGPDLVLHEQGELAAPLVAAVLDRPSVTHSFGSAIPPDHLAAAAGRVAPLWADHGLQVPPFAGSFTSMYLDIYPASMQGDGA